MKTIIILFLSVAMCNGQTIKVNAGLDSVTNTRQKAELTGMVFDGMGDLIHCTYIIRKYALDNTTVIVPNGSETKRTLLEAKEYSFQVGNKYVNTITKAIVPDSTNSNHARLRHYLSAKAINTYPGVTNGSALKILVEGLLRELINVKQASKLLPN